MGALGALLQLLVYVGIVFALPPVLGRRAARSPKARIAFFILCGLMTGVALLTFALMGEISKRLFDPTTVKPGTDIHDVETMAVGAVAGPPLFAAGLLLGVILGMAGWFLAKRNSGSNQGKTNNPPTSP